MWRLITLSLLVSFWVACEADGRGGPTRDGGTSGDGSLPPPDSAPAGCTPGQPACAGAIHYTCAPDGISRMNEVTCDAACDPAGGCVACEPGSRRCDGTRSMVCGADGTGFVTARDCAESVSECGTNGFCADACGAAESSRSSIGCEYWAVPLPNAGSGPDWRTRFDFRIVVANPDQSADANIRVFRGSNMVQQFSVPPGGVTDQVLPWIDELTTAFELPMPAPFGPQPAPAWDSPAAANGAYRVVSDRPVTVAEFNPFEYDSGSGTMLERFSYANDASLLLPFHGFTGEYIASSFPTLSVTNVIQDPFDGEVELHRPAPSYLAVVGTTPEPTEVQVTVTSPLAAASDGRFPATERGGTVNFTIQRGEVVVLASAPTPPCRSNRAGYEVTPANPPFQPERRFCNEAEYDMTGSRVSASNPVAVFGGHECAFVPYNRFACDHLENQLPPLQTWGREYVTGPLGDPGPNVRNVVRIVAAFDGTEVTVDPPQGGASTISLNAGNWEEFEATTAFRVSANNGVMVTQFLVGQNASTPAADRGDPAMVVLPPKEQFRSDYTFVAPTSYSSATQGQSYILITRPTGMDVMLDGSPANTTWTSVFDVEVGIVEINGGNHTMQASQPFGAIVYGMGQFTSYAYPAGLDLETILLI